MMVAATAKSPAGARRGGALKLHRRCAYGEVSIASLKQLSPAFQPLLGDGTGLAISNFTSGVAPHLPPSTGRGGSRNRAGRESHALTVGHIANLSAAERHAAKIGLPLTRMITVHWEAAGVPLEGMPKATGRFTDLLTKALARHGSATAWLWVHENGAGKGGHCHLLVHVPADLVQRLTKLQKGWLRKITGKPYRARVIHSKPIGARLGLEVGNPDLHAINLEAALTYLVKGASQAAASAYNLERLEPGGLTIGKRCGTSQNIGEKARKAKDGLWQEH